MSYSAGIERRYRVAAGLAALILLCLWLLPVGVKLGAEHWLESRGYQAAIANVDLNLFTGRLAVDGVEATTGAGDGFRIAHAAVRLRYLPLFDRHLHFAELVLRDAVVDVRRGETVRVAGFEIAGGEPRPAAKQTVRWGFGLDTADIDGLVVDYHEPGYSQRIVLATSTTTDVATWRPRMPIPLNLDLRLDEATIGVRGELHPFGGKIAGDLDLRLENLQLSAIAPLVEGRAGIAELAGEVRGDLNIAFDYAPTAGFDLNVSGTAGLSGGRVVFPDTATLDGEIAWDGKIAARLLRPPEAVDGNALDTDGSLTLTDAVIELPSAQYDIGAGQLLWTGEAGLFPPHAAGKIDGRELRIDDRRVGRNLARAGSLEIGGITLTGANDLRVERVTAGDIEMLERAPDAPERDEYPQILTLAALEMTGIEWRERERWNIERLAANGARGLLLRRDGGTEFKAWLAPAGEESSAETDPRIVLDTLVLTGDNRLRIEDHGIDPATALDLSQLQLELRAIDTGDPGHASGITLSSQVGRYGRIKGEGELTLFADPPSLTFSGEARSVDLVPFSGYIRRALEQRIEQGTMDAELNVTVDAGDIDGLADLTLRKFRLGNVIGESGAVERKLGLPLSRTLSLLRDSDGDVRLSLPLGGNLEDPTFSSDRIIQQAVFEGLQTAVLTYYSPLGAIKIAGKLVDLATALRFQPVPFEPGETALTADAREYLDKMIELLGKRPKARFVICGHAVPADREAIAVDPAPPASGSGNAEAVDDLREALLAIAEERTTAVSRYLVNGGIDSDRLVPCNPSVDTDENARPRTSVSL